MRLQGRKLKRKKGGVVTTALYQHHGGGTAPVKFTSIIYRQPKYFTFRNIICLSRTFNNGSYRPDLKARSAKTTHNIIIFAFLLTRQRTSAATKQAMNIGL